MSNTAEMSLTTLCLLELAMASRRNGKFVSPLSASTQGVLQPRLLPLGISAILFICLLVPLQSRTIWIQDRSALNSHSKQISTTQVHRWDGYTLESALKSVASNGTVIVCVVSYPYLAFLVNWLVGISKQNRHEQVLVIAEDYEMLHYVNKMWPGHAVLIPPALPSIDAHKFGSQGFFNFTSRRPRHLLSILELGYSVLYNDVDMVWLADPFNYLVGNHDIYFTDDMSAVKPREHSHELPPPGKKGRTYICSCMLFLRPTPGAKLVLKKWVDELYSQPWSPKAKTNDQPAFNWALNKTAGQVDMYLLSQEAFPCGGLYFRNSTWRRESQSRNVIIHNNYILGFEKKTKRFREFNLWFLDDEKSMNEASQKLEIVSNYVKTHIST